VLTSSNEYDGNKKVPDITLEPINELNEAAMGEAEGEASSVKAASPVVVTAFSTGVEDNIEVTISVGSLDDRSG